MDINESGAAKSQSSCLDFGVVLPIVDQTQNLLQGA